ncbi:proline-rich protein 36 [Pygocentrus nattereri]|uniref:proline-rich protein 36 n=1 Tax=Pygocentrus nattereri TaxID=42514 RepID=UPI001890D3ED|nr:proline-rich protein 36 [Pygocentrus nattereri]
MKKSSLHFLKQKSPNLFDTNVQIKHYDNVEFKLDSAAIPESGTAKVRSRPTVKHFSTSGDGALGFAVPTPTVPVLPPMNGPQSHTGSTEKLPNGSMISVADLDEGEILIPAPPSVAPPPPPQFIPPSPQYIPPPLEFFGALDPPVDLAALQPPSMPPPKPPSITGFTISEELELASLKPPPMAPPKPPTDIPSLKTSAPISSPINVVQGIPECPKFTPPLPPVEKPQSSLIKAQKMPPPKPVRLSSIYNLTEVTPTPTPASTPASSFNPQTTAKLYSVPKTTVLTSQADREMRAPHILLLEDTSGNPVGVHVNGRAPLSAKEVSPAQDVVPPVKPVRRNSSGLQLDTDILDGLETLPNEVSKPNSTSNEELAKGVTLQEVSNKIPAPVKGSPKTESALAMPSAQEVSQVKELPASPSKPRSYSPLLNRKLHTLKGHEGSSGKETAASPLALLKAAKEREKQRSALSRKSSTKSSSSAESLNVGIHPNETRPNSFTVTPTPLSSESLNTEPKQSILIESQPKSQSPKVSRPEPSPVSHTAPSNNPVKHPTSASPSSQEDGSEGAVHYIPPPPEFANSDPEDEIPPSTPPPDPLAKSVAQPVKSIPDTNGPVAPPKPKTSSTATSPSAAPSTEPKLKKLQIKQQAPPGQPPVQVSALPLTQPKTQTQIQTPPPAQPKTQIPSPPPTQPPAPPTQPKTQLPAPPPSQPKTQIPSPPSTQPPAPPTQRKTQLPAPPPTQPKTQIPSPPPTQPPAPPTQPKTQIPTPPPTHPKSQIPAPPPTHPKSQIPAPPQTQPPAPPPSQTKTQLPGPPPTQPKTQPPAPPPTQLKTQPPAPPPAQHKTQTQSPPPPQAKTQIPTQPPPSVSASQATLLSILQKKMLEMDPKFAPARETDSSGDDWNSPLSDDDGATSPLPKTSPKPKTTTVPIQTQGLDMKELEAKAAEKAQNLATKAPRNGPQSKQQYGMTFTIRPGTKQPITPVMKTD